MIKKAIPAALICLALSMCSRPEPRLVYSPASAEEQAYFNKATATPLRFTASRERNAEVWERIRVFIIRYSPVEVRTPDEFSIVTFVPQWSEDFSYSASRMRRGNMVEFTVSCIHGRFGVDAPAQQNAHVLAHYALTGELNGKFVRT